MAKQSPLNISIQKVQLYNKILICCSLHRLEDSLNILIEFVLEEGVPSDILPEISNFTVIRGSIFNLFTSLGRCHIS